MNDEREVIGVWDWDQRSFSHARNKRHAEAREDYINEHFLTSARRRTPPYIWKVEFFRTVVTPRSSPEQYEFGMTLHRYASNAEGKRHQVWVRAYDEHGDQVSTRLVATCEPENYRVESLPPDWLLYNTPEPK